MPDKVSENPIPPHALAAVEQVKSGVYPLPKLGPADISPNLKKRLVVGAKNGTGNEEAA